MICKNLITSITLATAMTTGSAFAQGNPHLDAVSNAQQVASIQGNPHIGFEMSNEVVARYRGNPHEGYISKVVLVAGTQGNPQAGFKLVPLKIASSE